MGFFLLTNALPAIFRDANMFRRQRGSANSLMTAYRMGGRPLISSHTHTRLAQNKALIRESTSPALKACSTVAELHPEVGRELFHAAFVSCWADL